MPKLWNATIEAHRRDVREAILDTTWHLAKAHGPAAVRMSEIAEQVGIGRATLYKYFPDVAAILAAWHQRQIDRHLEHLATIREEVTEPEQRLNAVLEGYARIHQRRVQHQRDAARGGELVSLVHTDDRVSDAQQRLHDFMCEVIGEAAAAGTVRDDIPADELADYCLHALTAAATLKGHSAIRRLVGLTLTGLRPDP